MRKVIWRKGQRRKRDKACEKKRLLKKNTKKFQQEEKKVTAES